MSGRFDRLSVALVLAAVVWTAHAQSRQERLADRRVPDTPTIVLQSGVTNPAAFAVIERVLQATGVPFGIEGTPASPLEMGSLVRAVERVSLNGETLRDALDAIVKQAPAFRWTESSGRILVRGTAEPEGILPRPIDRLSLTNASPRDALNALVSALGRSPAGDGASSGPPDAARSHAVTVDLGSTTVRDALNRIADASQLSWTIRYVASPPSVGTASLTLSAPGLNVTSPAPSSEPASPASDRYRSSGELASLLVAFANRVHVQVGVELIDDLSRLVTPVDVPLIAADGIAGIVRAEPRYTWTNDDGFFHVRPSGSAPTPLQWLDERLPGLQVANTALGEVFDRIFWLRGVQPGGSGAWFKPDRPEVAPVTLTVPPGTTVRATLDALCRAQGTASWVARPRNPSGLEIELTGGVAWRLIRDELPTAAAPLPVRPVSVVASGDVRATGTDVGGLAVSYARQTGRQVVVELGAVSETAAATRSSRSLVLPAGAPEDALRTIARDGGYELTTSQGIYHLALPYGSTSRLPLLDTSVGSFTADHEPLAMVFDRILWQLGAQPGLGGRPIATDAPVTLHVQGPTTIRGLLDALLEADRSLSVEMRQVQYASAFLDVTLSGGGGWPLTRRIMVPIERLNLPASPLSGPPRAALPASLERHIDQFTAYLNRDGDSSFEHLASVAAVPMGIEMLPEKPAPSDARVRSGAPPPPTLVGPGTLTEALSLLLERHPGYEMTMADSIINISPSSLTHDPAHFLDLALPHFDVDDVPIEDAVRLLRHAINPAVPLPRPNAGVAASVLTSLNDPADGLKRLSAAQALFTRHVTLHVTNATPRHILNQLVSQHGELFWEAVYRGRSPQDAASAIETDCTIYLNTFSATNMRTQIDPVRSPAPPQPLTPGVTPRTMLSPGAGPLIVQQPDNGLNLRSALGVLARSTRTLMGIEVIAPPVAEPLNGRPQIDLAGLPLDAALNRLLSTVPGYVWRRDGGVIHVMPAALQHAPGAALATRIDRGDVTLPSAFDAIMTIFEWLGHTMPPRRGPAPPNLRAFADKPMTVATRDRTVRDVLDAIIRQAGDEYWTAMYVDDTASASRLALGLNGFDFGSINATAPPR